jgi:hypothetical protein
MKTLLLLFVLTVLGALTSGCAARSYSSTESHLPAVPQCGVNLSWCCWQDAGGTTHCEPEN